MKEKSKQKKDSPKKAESKEILVGTRGRIFQGKIIRKFPKRITIEFERTVYVPKYERFFKRRSRMHARIPENADVKIGDLVKVQECRPLSKITKFMFLEKISSGSEEITTIKEKIVEERK